MKKTSIGGQAVIEGVMMKGPDSIAIAIRKPDGEIELKKERLKSNRKAISKLPIIRGMFAFVDAMVIGIKALSFSAEFIEEEEEKKPKKPSKWDNFLDKNMIVISIVFSILFSIGLFILLPTLAVSFIGNVSKSPLVMNLIEGVVRVAIFVGYIAAISRMKDIKRVFEYHGAEHKTIFCYENEEELTPENARKFTRLHPRCGTSFLFLVMIVSILLFSFFRWPNLLMRLVIRIALMPLVAGISYEIIKWAGRSDSKLVCAISAPGLWLQKITTQEPDDSQLEVAIEALKNVLVEDREADLW